MAPEYLFIRILETCNADCFMCGFRLSKDRYRLSLNALEGILSRVKKEGIRYIRLTGGEPLVHAEIVEFIRLIRQQGMKSSIITNGFLLEKKVGALAEAGLDQVIVSIDAARPQTHDEIRNTRGLFERATAGLREAMRGGVMGRVNTVCGPGNFREMPALQDLLTAWGVSQWELSSLKLERKLDYTEQDQREIEEVVEYVYREAPKANRLVPMGKVWCGETAGERARYFATGITPRADGTCLLVDKVRYLDAKNNQLYACSLIPHRPGAWDYAAPGLPPEEFSVLEPNIMNQAAYFKYAGPSVCTGCSTTAAGYSNQLRSNEMLSPWSF